jgi:hypothetical protein
MKAIRIIVLIFVCINFVGLLYLFKDIQIEKETNRLTQNIVRMYKTEIRRAQNNGHLYIYDPIMTSQIELIDIFELLDHKGGIRRMTFDGSPLHVFDKKIIEIILTMPDIEILEINGARLSDGLFEPLNELSRIHTLVVQRCFAGPEAYDLAHAKNLKSLSILNPLEFDYDGKPTTISPQKLQNTIDFLYQCKHLDYILLDRVFFEWKNDLLINLPSTEIYFDAHNSYSCSIVPRSP